MWDSRLARSTAKEKLIYAREVLEMVIFVGRWLAIVWILQVLGCDGANASLRRLQSNFASAESCPVPQDIVFVVDSSSSVGSERFDKIVRTVMEAIRALPPIVRIGVVRFSDDFEVVYALSFASDQFAVVDPLSRINYTGGETNMGPALTAAHNLFDTTSKERNQIIVCLTNGNPNDWDETRRSATDIINDGILLMFGRLGEVDIQKGKQQLLAEVVSPPASENMFDFQNSRDLLLRLHAPCPCLVGDRVEVIIADKSRVVVLDDIMQNGTITSRSCADVIQGYTGEVKIECKATLSFNDRNEIVTKSELLATPTCKQTCGIDSQTSVSIGGLALVRPTGEIPSGGGEERPCASIFPNSQGTIQLTCSGGLLNASNDCSAIPKTCPQLPSCTVFEWAFVVSAVLNVILIVIVIEWNVRWRRLPAPKMIDQRSIVPHSPPVPTVCKVDFETQTDPVVYVEQMRGMQMPLDIVFCVDSSISVDQADFGHAVSFLDEVAMHLDMPTVRAGLIQFNDQLPFPSIQPITGDPAVLRSSVRGMLSKRTLDMLGETKMADPIRAAADMFSILWRDAPKVIVMLTDGDPNDLEATIHAAEWAKNHRNIRLFFVHLRSRPKSRSGQNQLGIIEQLASSPSERNVVQLEGYAKLPGAVAYVLSQILCVDLWAKRAKCTIPFEPHYVVSNADDVEGLEVLCPGWDPGPHQDWKLNLSGVYYSSEIVPWVLGDKQSNWAEANAARLLSVTGEDRYNEPPAMALNQKPQDSSVIGELPSLQNSTLQPASISPYPLDRPDASTGNTSIVAAGASPSPTRLPAIPQLQIPMSAAPATYESVQWRRPPGWPVKRATPSALDIN